jgi:hypothetical protein
MGMSQGWDLEGAPRRVRRRSQIRMKKVRRRRMIV